MTTVDFIYLHSTMLLLYPMAVIVCAVVVGIYIPLCFYFITPIPETISPVNIIYIPLCFYFIGDDNDEGC